MFARQWAEALIEQGRVAEAILQTEQAANAGEPEALLLSAHWSLFGLHRPRDLAAAHRRLEQAAARGLAEAIRLRATLIANGTGRESDPRAARAMLKQAGKDPEAAAQLKMLAGMPPVEATAKCRTSILCRDPEIRLVHGLLTKAETRYLRSRAEPFLQPSVVVDTRTGQRVANPIRTSIGMSFGPAQEDLVVHAINCKIAAATSTEGGWGEPLHILHYSRGQQYRPHVDPIPGLRNQRQMTVLTYLNEDYEGGETSFLDLGIATKGREGDALVFRNLIDGRSDPRTRHAGLPVTEGVKWLATRWIRQGPYHPWLEDPTGAAD